MIARRILYEGRVQGVGFRYTAQHIACGFDVVGWVKNLPDGRVEMQVMSAEASELEAFLDEIRLNSPLAHLIKKVTIDPIPPLGGIKGFDIVH
jgi:acylphosphatase